MPVVRSRHGAISPCDDTTTTATLNGTSTTRRSSRLAYATTSRGTELCRAKGGRNIASIRKDAPAVPPTNTTVLDLIPNGTIPAGPIDIDGLSLTPASNGRPFDAFWRFLVERKEIDDARRAGKKYPWTQDSVLQKNKFCNIYRILDRTTQDLIQVIQTGSAEPMDVLFRTLLFSVFVRTETYQLLDRQLGPLTWHKFNQNPDAFVDVLDGAKFRGKSLYTGAFQRPGPRYTEKNWADHLIILRGMMRGGQLLKVIQSASHVQDIYAFLRSYPTFAEFTAFQLALNLRYTDLLPEAAKGIVNNFVIAGPGAQAGISKIFGVSAVKKCRGKIGLEFDNKVILRLTEMQASQFQRIGCAPVGLGPDRLPMQPEDMEHALCEFDKYARSALPNIKGAKLRDPLSNKYSPQASLPSEVIIPASWSQPSASSQCPINDLVIPPLVLLVREIDGVRTTESGIREFHVKWWGYDGPGDDWEEEQSLDYDKDEIDRYLAASSNI